MIVDTGDRYTTFYPFSRRISWVYGAPRLAVWWDGYTHCLVCGLPVCNKARKACIVNDYAARVLFRSRLVFLRCGGRRRGGARFADDAVHAARALVIFEELAALS